MDCPELEWQYLRYIDVIIGTWHTYSPYVSFSRFTNLSYVLCLPFSVMHRLNFSGIVHSTLDQASCSASPEKPMTGDIIAPSTWKIIGCHYGA